MNSREASRKSRQSRNTVFRNNLIMLSTKTHEKLVEFILSFTPLLSFVRLYSIIYIYCRQ